MPPEIDLYDYYDLKWILSDNRACLMNVNTNKQVCVNLLPEIVFLQSLR